MSKIQSSIIFFVFFVMYVQAIAQPSVLSQGHWYKVGVVEDGVYTIDAQALQTMGFDVHNINPKQLCIYGLAGAPLDESPTSTTTFGVQEQAIIVEGEADGSFDANDKILFYGLGTRSWQYEPVKELYEWVPNIYADTNYYFIGIQAQGGKRIEQQASLSLPSAKKVTTTLHTQVFDKDKVNLLKSGKQWLGDSFSTDTVIRHSFYVPHLVKNNNIHLDISYATVVKNRDTYLNLKINNSQNYRFKAVPMALSEHYSVAHAAHKTLLFKSQKDSLNLCLTYEKDQLKDNVYLDYFAINASTHLTMLSIHQLPFCYYAEQANTKLQFRIAGNTNMQTRVWNTSDPYNVKEISGFNYTADTLVFGVKTKGDNRFVAFDGQEYKTPIQVGNVDNQDLLSLAPFQMLIVAPDMFLEQANRVAEMHRQQDGMVVEVVSLPAIYNEFSSGKQDPTAIRNLVKYYYDKATQDSDKPKYILLFGDASYDYKNYIPDNTNIVPTYESQESFNGTKSYCTDDYFGTMGGHGLRDTTRAANIDVAVGRFPAHSLQQAITCVNKTLRYAHYFDDALLQQMHANVEDITPSKAGFGPWRNQILFVADDDDSNRHFKKAEKYSKALKAHYPVYNVEKIYSDSYVLEHEADGLYYPGANRAINTTLNRGVLFFNYNGHGGHTGLTGENVLKTHDVLHWDNIDKLTVFLVASCEFGPYDNPGHVSTGEYVLLSPNGGGAAIMTTTRLASASNNGAINSAIMSVAFDKQTNGRPYALGDMVKYAKNHHNNPSGLYNFTLLGDPALCISYAQQHVATTKVSNNYGSVSDANIVQGRQTVHIEAQVQTDSVSHVLSPLNGTAYVSVYGHPSTYHTLANQGSSIAKPFEVIDKLLFKTEVEVKNGVFEFDFVVPEEVGADEFQARISYYVCTDSAPWQDAKGVCANFVMGGIDTTLAPDTTPPDIVAYINDKTFTSYQKVDNPATLLVDLFDNSGINNINWDFGREIQAVLDQEQTFYLNDFFKHADGSSKEGYINFPLPLLQQGKHAITVKAWDIFDNYAEHTIHFYVDNDNIGDLQLISVVNSPNPCSIGSTFLVKHNAFDQNSLQVNIQLFDMYGNRVWQYEKEHAVVGNTLSPIEMNVNNSPLGQLSSGVYAYFIEIKNNKGQHAQQKQKIVVVK